MRIRVENGKNQSDMRLPATDVEMNFWMRRIGVEEVIPYCSIQSVIGEGNLLTVLEGKRVNMDEVNFLAKRLAGMTAYEKEIFVAYAGNKRLESEKDMINFTYSLTGISLISDFSDRTQVGKRLYMDKFQGMTQEESQQVDFEKYAEEVLASQEVTVTPYGVLVENGFAMQEVYNGMTFPEYVFQPDSTVAVLEVANPKGDTDYLYLPTDICSVSKVKARLGAGRLDECRMASLRNLRLPEAIVGQAEIRNAEELTLFNEMCQAVCQFDTAKMEKIGMVIAYAGAQKYAEMTCLAKKLCAFEIIPAIYDDAGYGEYQVKSSGVFQVDRLLLPYIDYAAFGRFRREAVLAEGGYTENGFVGCREPVREYMQYGGEYADPLELCEDSYETLRLYSPLKASHVIDDEEENLHGTDLYYYAKEIRAAIRQENSMGEEARGLMHYFHGQLSIAAKVIQAVPWVEETDEELFGVLECKIREPLTKEELAGLKDYWCGQMSDGWGEGFEQWPISVDEGDIYVSFWSNEADWKIMTEQELNEEQEQKLYLGI